MKALILLFAMLPGAGPRQVAANEPADTLSIQIVPETFRVDRRWLRLRQFHVVVTNNGAKPIRLWREWCSWGYFNLSFEARGQDGKPTKITLAPRPWDKNFPDWTAIPPGEHFVIDVNLQEPPWTANPGTMPKPQQTVRLRAIYEIPRDKEAKDNGVWTGRVSSDERAYTFE